MTPLLRDLLRRFGEIEATTHFYANTRPPGQVEFPGEHYPPTDLEPDEPALVVKISRDGETRISPVINADGTPSETVKVMELPEDEFWHFEAFRPAVSRLSLGPPGFLFEMALITLYGVFEAFLADVLRGRLRRMPHLLSPRAQRTLAGTRAAGPSAPAPDLEEVIDQEVRRITHGSITAVLAHLRDHLGMSGLLEEHDGPIQIVALVRNCLLHAGGQVDRRLGAAAAIYKEDNRITIAESDLWAMARAIRNLAYAIGCEDEASVVQPPSQAEAD